VKRLIPFAFFLFISLQASAFASTVTGAVGSYSFVRTAETRLFIFGISGNEKDNPGCNSSGKFAIDPRFPDAPILISLLINLHNNTLGTFKSTPTVTVETVGQCTRQQDAEDVQAVIIMESDKDLYGAYFLANYGTLTYNLNLPVSPIIRNASPTRSPKLRDTIQQYADGVCSIGPVEAGKKWDSLKAQPPQPDQSLVDKVIQGILNDHLYVPVTKFLCTGDSWIQRTGMNAYSEAISGDSASALWQDNGGHFHGASLFKESGAWKIGKVDP
jgi:hypothetical protein